MALSLPALSLELIGRKRELLLERIWKVASVSTVSGIMPIAGYNLTADIELLQNEIKFYRHQLGNIFLIFIIKFYFDCLKVVQLDSNCSINLEIIWLYYIIL